MYYIYQYGMQYFYFSLLFLFDFLFFYYLFQLAALIRAFQSMELLNILNLWTYQKVGTTCRKKETTDKGKVNTDRGNQIEEGSCKRDSRTN